MKQNGNGKQITVQYRFGVGPTMTDRDSMMLLPVRASRDISVQNFGEEFVSQNGFYIAIQTPFYAGTLALLLGKNWVYGKLKVNATNARLQGKSYTAFAAKLRVFQDRKKK